MSEVRRILVPVDGSESSGRAARFAAEIASATNAPLTLLHVFDAPALEVLGMTNLDKAALAKVEENISKKSFEKAVQAIFGIEVADVNEVTRIGHPATAILAYAKEAEIGHIVMGCRGRSRAAEIVLGSVSERVLHHANCPVTIIH